MLTLLQLLINDGLYLIYLGFNILILYFLFCMLKLKYSFVKNIYIKLLTYMRFYNNVKF